MVLSLGIKLVIALPSFLFLIGFIFKGILEKYQMGEIENLDLKFNHLLDFLYIFSIESVFLIVANGLIIIFEMQNIEFGILLIIAGLIFSLFTSIGSYKGHTTSSAIGLTGTLAIIGWELGYFLSQDLFGAFPLIISFISMFLGVVLIFNFITITGKREFLSKFYISIKKLLHLH
ncbi:MAG: hypothetical protein O8C62_08015 [Candidatus Methanoperedens sp.]|jgi:hypothetical protein|nr:hypothetical protein [Candidatus Methanoperedens sp.]